MKFQELSLYRVIFIHAFYSVIWSEYELWGDEKLYVKPKIQAIALVTLIGQFDPKNLAELERS